MNTVVVCLRDSRCNLDSELTRQISFTLFPQVSIYCSSNDGSLPQLLQSQFEALAHMYLLQAESFAILQTRTLHDHGEPSILCRHKSSSTVASYSLDTLSGMFARQDCRIVRGSKPQFLIAEIISHFCGGPLPENIPWRWQLARDTVRHSSLLRENVVLWNWQPGPTYQRKWQLRWDHEEQDNNQIYTIS